MPSLKANRSGPLMHLSFLVKSSRRFRRTAADLGSLAEDQEDEAEGGSEDGLGAVNQALDAVKARDPNGVTEALAGLLNEQGVEPNIALNRRYTHMLLRFEAGDANALAALRTMAEDPKTCTLSGIEMYVEALGRMGEEQQAADALASLGMSLTSGERAKIRLLRGQNLATSGNLSEAHAAFLSLSADAEVDVAIRARAYVEISKLTAETDSIGALAYRELGLALDPTDARARFDLAYAYGEQGMTELSILHYDGLRAANQATPVALNNLAVSLAEVGEPFAAFEMYREAVERGSALAAANLAHLALRSGDHIGARTWINRARELEPTQDRAISAEGILLERQEKERELRRETLKVARAFQRTIRRASQGAIDPTCISGRWTLGGTEFVFSPDENGIVQGVRGDAEVISIRSVPGAPLLRVEVARKQSYTTTTLEGFGMMENERVLVLCVRGTGSGSGKIYRLERVDAPAIEARAEDRDRAFD
jgi:Flp pilus assembly protein TadD